jgi:hypothetical protein
MLGRGGGRGAEASVETLAMRGASGRVNVLSSMPVFFASAGLSHVMPSGGADVI